MLKLILSIFLTTVLGHSDSASHPQIQDCVSPEFSGCYWRACPNKPTGIRMCRQCPGYPSCCDKKISPPPTSD